MASPVRVSPVKVIALTPGWRGQELAGRARAEAMHHVIDAVRHAHLVHHFAEQRGRLRRFFRRLDHDRVAAGERGATFQVISNSGRFHGQITATTPTGARTA